MSGRITKSRVDSALPGQVLWDSEAKGFGLRTGKGGAKTYVLKYRRGRVQRWYTIGRHGSPWTAEGARREAVRLLGMIAEGRDPSSERRDDRDAETLEEFSRRYIDEYAREHKRDSSIAEDERNLRLHILPRLGKLRVRDITRTDVHGLHYSMRETPYGANRVLALLSHIMKMAEAWGLREDHSNPCPHVKKYKEHARSRFLSTPELLHLGEALRRELSDNGNPYPVAAIRLLLFTGARLSEILTLKWDYVDYDACLLRLPDSKTGEKTIPLGAPALKVLQALPRQEGNPWVICGKSNGARLINLQKPWQRIRRRAGLTDVRIHDLRHSFASVAASSGMGLPIIGAMLGHSQAQTTQRYAHLSDDPRIEAANSVANEIAATLDDVTSDIIPSKTNVKGK